MRLRGSGRHDRCVESASLLADPGDWSRLGQGARLFRVVHGVYSVFGLGSLAYIWLSAVRRRRDRYLALAVGFLSMEGIALIKGRGNCPFGPLQASLGDPVPFFELVLPPRAAKAAIPILAWGSIVGMVAALLRPPPGSLQGR
jgi:hypothetical protein